ncbi:uncharacterized protein EDB91DRAFT_609285 [Suillus paluster]|uniref:uncharacterized protein n=1 Tax=Suillus paluster TaxID=48578 RepID=UPI001B87E948|nr:uncharacterized protein EDB91DRAFT_609285 [Suillus paluster]KAG1751460.1 hypothetical protein EDB91DRAFT_609285 [Suillus paluster]
MHPALGNLEIVCIISSYTQRRSLPALASTCRAFEHPALDALWRDLQSIQPLVKCLPSDLFSIDKGPMVLQKPLDRKMWDTLFKYTSRVHSITVPESGYRDDRTFILPVTVLMLSCPSTPASLFPNLRKLTWRAEGIADFLRMALVPSILVLDMQISSAAPPAFLSVLSSLGTLCPHLQNMTITVNARYRLPDDLLGKFSSFIIQPIPQLHHLHTLSVWDLGNEGIEHLMQLRALQSLRLDLGTSSAWDTKSPLQFPGFHDLKLLGLCTSTLQHASNFLSSLQVVRSKELEVRYTSRSESSSASAYTALSEFFTILQEKCDNDRLEFFSLRGVSGQIPTVPSVLTPLHACRNLTRLVIERVCDISMSDEELCQLVGGWPKLQVLKISNYVTLGSTTIPTFHGLISLLQLCPALTSLGLVIDTTELDGIDLKRPGGGSYNPHLKFLAFGNSPIESPVDVALVLSGLFPYLKQVNLDCWDTSSKKMERWTSVNSILDGFRVLEGRLIGT